MPVLLTRDQFRERTLARHGGRCAIPGCPRPATDAHHLLNRRLFTAAHESGGYYLDNGANLCPEHHLDAERTLISVEDLRSYCGITDPVLPEHLAADTPYDTWGNPIVDGARLAGELFTDPGCQAALAAGGVLWQFTPYVKYPRTYHLPWSPGRTADDRTATDLTALTEAPEVVITLKMDGEATTIYPDGHTHARSLSTKAHPSRDHLRALAATLAHDIPPGHRLCGENVYAVHSIAYTDLPAHFLLYSIWDGPRCLDWDETTEWAELLDLPAVPVIYRGPMPTQADLDTLFAPHATQHEGYVIRPAGSFTLAQFPSHVLKWVREQHVTTDQHWLHGPMRTNTLAENG